MKYEVTIGIPVYESAPYIRRALMSALNQTYPSIEFLIVDDCGKDGSVAIIREIADAHPRGKDIRIIKNGKNLGVAVSRNAIIEEAQGAYLYFMDSDDAIADNTIELLMGGIRQYDAEIAFGSYERIELSGERHVWQYPSLQLFGEDQLASFAYRKYGGIQASACNYLVKTSILRDHDCRFIDTEYWEDMAFTFNLVTYISKAVLLPDITYSYYCRENSLSNYQERTVISKDEIMRNVKTVDYLKHTSSLYINKVYYPDRCYIISMTNFYIVSNILKRRKNILPRFADCEIRAMMSHTASFSQICHFRNGLLKNLAMYFISKLPAQLCVGTIWCLAKAKKLI